MKMRHLREQNGEGRYHPQLLPRPGGRLRQAGGLLRPDPHWHEVAAGEALRRQAKAVSRPQGPQTLAHPANCNSSMKNGCFNNVTTRKKYQETGVMSIESEHTLEALGHK